MATVAPEKANWFTYFPDDYRWSAATVGILSTAPYGGADIGEVDRAGRRLRGRVGDDEAWFKEWVRVGDEVRGLAEDADGDDRRFSAASAYLRACSYYQMAERFRTPKDEAVLDVFSTSLRCFKRFTELTDTPRIEAVEVPYEGGSLPAYFVHAQNTDEAKSPCVVYFDGLDITKELQYLRGVPELVRRGMSCLIVDGPGTGEAIRFRGLNLRYDYDVAGSAAVDYLETRPDVDADRLGVMAVSLGGYYAPRCASKEHRFKACVAWGAIWDYHATWKKRIDAAFNSSLSVPSHHITWILGVDTLDEALEKLEDFKLDGVVQDMRCSFLITHGEEDEQVPLADAKKLYEASGSPDKTLRAFNSEEGGSQHCQRDNLTIGIATMFDWLQGKL